MIKLIIKFMKCGGFFIGFILYATSALYASNAFSFSYEDTTDIRRAVIAQNGNNNLTATDSSGRTLEEDFSTIQAPVFNIPANGLRNAVDNYIDERVAAVGLNLPEILSNLNMGSALYTHQQTITFDSENYDINYSVLVKENGDYVVLGRSLVPENPTFLATYYLSGEGNPANENYNRVYVYQGDVTNDETNPLTADDLIYIYDIDSYHSPAALAGVLAASANIEVQHKNTHICPIFSMPAGVTDDVDAYKTYGERRGNLNVRTYCNPASNAERVLDWFDGNADEIDLTYNTVDNNGNDIVVNNNINLNRIQDGMVYGVIDNVKTADNILTPLINLATSSVCNFFYSDLNGAQTTWEYISGTQTTANISYYFVDTKELGELPNGEPTPSMKLLDKGKIQQPPDLLANLALADFGAAATPTTITFFAVNSDIPSDDNHVVFPIVDIDTISNKATIAGEILTPAQMIAQHNITVTVPNKGIQPTHHKFRNSTFKLQFASLCNPDDPDDNLVCWTNEAYRSIVTVHTEFCLAGPISGNPPHGDYTNDKNWHEGNIALHIFGTIGTSLHIEGVASDESIISVTINTGREFDYYVKDIFELFGYGTGQPKAVIRPLLADGSAGTTTLQASVRIITSIGHNAHNLWLKKYKYTGYISGLIEINGTAILNTRDYGRFRIGGSSYANGKTLCGSNALGDTPEDGFFGIVGSGAIENFEPDYDVFDPQNNPNICYTSSGFKNIVSSSFPIQYRARFLSETEKSSSCYDEYPNDIETRGAVVYDTTCP